MPKHKETLLIINVDNNNLLAIAYESFVKLGWNIDFAGNGKLMGSTPKSWKTKGQQILVGEENGEFVIESEMVNGETLDITGVNKKNATAFEKMFNDVKDNISISQIEKHNEAITVLTEKTVATNEQQVKEAEELDKAMNLNGANLYVTYSIIAINIIVFVLMVMDGAGIMDLNPLIHIKWGSNFTTLTLSGDWWRLVTSTFIHFGVIHVGMNMYCLYSVGVYLEPMLGKIKYVTAYLCTGVLASIVSLWWHTEGANSAGASGAVFGMYGLFLALLTSNLIPKAVRDSLLKSIGIFIFYNLAYGMKGGVDNAAHVGGLLSGFIIGYLFVFSIKKEKESLKASWVLPLVVATSIGISFFYVEKCKLPKEGRTEILSEIKDATFKDNEKFNEVYNEFVKMQETAISVMTDTTLENIDMKSKLINISMLEWNKAREVVKRMQSMDVGELKKKKAISMENYIDLRKEEIINFIDYLEGKNNAIEKLNNTRTAIGKLVETLQ